MRFLIDAQLPRRMARWLAAAGQDAVHTLDLPARNRTPDPDVTDLADAQQRAVITKDSDFVYSHTFHGRPAKLLLISTGNITNDDLERLMVPLIPAIVQEFQTNGFLELDVFGIIVRC